MTLHQMTHQLLLTKLTRTLNETIVGENQYGGAISNPFVKMTFKSFDKMHTKQGMKNNKKNKNLKWLSFQL